MRLAFDVGPVLDRPTGVGAFAASMSNALARALEADELALIGRRAGVIGLPSGLEEGPPISGRYMSWLQTRASRDVKRLKADVAHYSDGMVPLVRQGRTVLSVHDLSVVAQWRTHPARRLLRVPFVVASPHLADLVLAASQATADELMRLTGIKAAKIEVLHYAPYDALSPASADSISETLARYGLSKRGYVLALGTIEPRKNHARLVEALEILDRRGGLPRDLQLVVAGGAGWHSKPILRRFKESALSSRISVLGYIPAEDVGPLLSAAEVVAYPSTYEGFGLPIVEAMARGAAVVTSNVSSMPEVAGNAGFLVDPLDAADVARGIGDALDAVGADRAGIANRALTQANKFSWDKTAAAAIHHYRARFG
jgi:glycosyltransferase involved in cell wall biosynthesis